MPGRYKYQSGFTLLEVLIAMTILSLSLMAVYRNQSMTIKVVDYVRNLNMASNLAELKMVELLEEIKENGTSDFDENKEGDFELEGISGYSWKAEYLRIELPIPTDFNGEKLKETNPFLASAAPMIKPQLKKIKKNIDENFRQLKLTVFWANKKKSITIFDHYVDKKLMKAPIRKKPQEKKKKASSSKGEESGNKTGEEAK